MAVAQPTERDWASEMPAEEWEVYQPVVEATEREGLPFALGGGLAFSYYAKMWRNTKDLDFYMRHRDVPSMIGLLKHHGFEDYFDTRSYDRSWIYRSSKGDLIIDVIWSMPNHRGDVDVGWVTQGPMTTIRGTPLRILPAEELTWAKLYVFQRERCDWPDLLNVIHGAGPAMDWERLLERVGTDRRLLAGLLCVFSWMCPYRALELPNWLWDRLGLAPPPPGPRCEEGTRPRMLESRPWFAPLQRHERDTGNGHG